MAKMRAIEVAAKGAPLTLVERDVPEPGPGHVRVRVQACGVCHSDSMTVDGLMPNGHFPIVLGHEIAGVIDTVGEGVAGWTVGQRVGVGWFGGNCGHCEPCRRGDLIDCRNLETPGVTYDGGYAEFMVAPASALASIPDDLSPQDAAPLLCAGVTTFNALRESGARPGDLVAILGVGGLGHLGVQFAAKMGFRTVAIGRGGDKDNFAAKLGAHIYIDSGKQNVAEELTKLGGARVILSTVAGGKAVSEAFPGLGVRGKMVVVGIGMDPIEISEVDLISWSRTLVGHASGASIDSQDTLAFSALSGVRPMIETMPLERAAEAYDRMLKGEARFRMVLLTGQ